MITTKKQGNNLAEVIKDILDSEILKTGDDFKTIFKVFNNSWRFGEKIEVFVDTYNSKLLFRIAGDYKPKDIDLIGDYIKIGELNLKLLSRNQFFVDSVDINKRGSVYYTKELTEEKVKEYLVSKLFRKKLLSLSDKFLKDKLINKSTYSLLDLYEFKIRKEEATIEQKIFALYKIKILHEPVLSYLDLSNQEIELEIVKKNIIKDLSEINSIEKNVNVTDFSLWFDKKILKNTDNTLTSLFKETIQLIIKENINSNSNYILPKSKYTFSKHIIQLADNWKKLREETKNKKIKNSDLSRDIKKEFLQLLSYSFIKNMSRYDLLIYDLFSFLREDFIF